MAKLATRRRRRRQREAIKEAQAAGGVDIQARIQAGTQNSGPVPARIRKKPRKARLVAPDWLVQAHQAHLADINDRARKAITGMSTLMMKPGLSEAEWMTWRVGIIRARGQHWLNVYWLNVHLARKMAIHGRIIAEGR